MPLQHTGESSAHACARTRRQAQPCACVDDQNALEHLGERRGSGETELIVWPSRCKHSRHSFYVQSPYVNQISNYISQTVPMYGSWLKDVHFRFFCDSFVGYMCLSQWSMCFLYSSIHSSSFIPRLIENIYKCRQISEVGACSSFLSFLVGLSTTISAAGAEQLLLDMTSIKTILADLPALAGGDPPRRYDDDSSTTSSTSSYHFPPQIREVRQSGDGQG